MIDKRLIWGYVLISLPALSATAFSIFACHRLRPMYEEREKTALTAHYREIAEELRDDPSRGTTGLLPDERGRSRSMKPGRWGYVETGEEAVVWYKLFERAQVVRVPRYETTSFAAILVQTLDVSLVLFWLATIAGCALFRKSIKDRDDFIAASAHDLTTPLVALSRLIGTDDAEASLVVERLQLLVANLTDFLKLGGRRAKPKFEEVDIKGVLINSLRLFEDDYRWLREGETIEVETADEHKALADAELLRRILWNLFANELKYAAPYGRVSVRVESDETCVRVLFADEGPGISLRDRRRIFRRYFRVKTVLKSGKGGFGIGLCTARDFARAMGGDLTVRANAPKGSLFVLTLRRK